MKKILFCNVMNNYSDSYECLVPKHSKPINIISYTNGNYMLCVELEGCYDEHDTKEVYLRTLVGNVSIPNNYNYLCVVNNTQINPCVTNNNNSITIDMNNINDVSVFYIDENISLEEKREKKLKKLI